jgi:hypothetical protein
MKKVRVTGVQILTPSMIFFTTFLNFSKLISSLKAQVCKIFKNIQITNFFTEQHGFLKLYHSQIVFTQI